ncbi:MAG: hypothetical protein DHS20C11_27060 [Lysobacteraceae bacterium]|nr:MAG: hypothetical protein DHS20C11_27060 [Xanthomonadaceae bacterium]
MARMPIVGDPYLNSSSNLLRGRAGSGALIVVLAVASGIAGLGYQVIWAEQFALLLGSTQVAVAAVLAAFMLGLTLGSFLVGRVCARLQQPLRWYALAELVIAASALAMRPSVELAGGLLGPVLGASLDGTAAPPGLSTALYVCAAALLMLLPTMAMGATLPLLVESTLDRRGSARAGAGLYSANTLGAAMGALGTALVLLPQLGLANAIYVMVSINVLVALVAWQIAQPRSSRELAEETALARLPGLPLLVVFLCGVVSFIYEVFWTRVLVHHLGADVYAFGAMLAVLLFGIAIGALLIRRWNPGNPGVGFAHSQWLLALVAILSFKLVEVLPAPSMGHLGFWALIVERLLYVSALLLPVAVLIGVSLPLVMFWVNANRDHGGRGIAFAYASNTLGAIVGSLFGALWLLPNAGFGGTLWVVVVASIVIGILAWLGSGAGHRIRSGMVASAIAVALLVWPPSEPDKLYRTTPLNTAQTNGSLAFAEVGRTSTVALVELAIGWRLLTNGLPESMIQRPGDSPSRFDVSHWLSLLPSTLHPDARDMLIVGLGGGGTAEDIVESIETIDVVELETQVLAANQQVAELRRSNPLADPRLTVHLNDARMELKRSNRQFDVIVAQPSHPWTSGASHLYTKEYFELVRERLAGDGLFSQWIGLQFVDQSLTLALLATLQEVFGHVQVYAPAQQAALIFIASSQPLPVIPTAGFSRHAKYWRDLGVGSLEQLVAAKVLDQATVDELAAAGELTTDYHNLLKYSAPRILNRPMGRQGLYKLVGSKYAAAGIDADASQLDSGRLLRALASFSPAAARRFAGDDPGRLALVNTWRPIDKTGRVDLVPALTDSALEEQAVAILFHRFLDRLIAGEALPAVRQWLRPTIEQPLLQLAVAARTGSAREVALRRDWLADTFDSGSPYYKIASQLQAQAAIEIDDQDWMKLLLNERWNELEGAVLLQYELMMATRHFEGAALVLMQWRQQLNGRQPGLPFRRAISRFEREAGALVNDPRFVVARGQLRTSQ